MKNIDAFDIVVCVVGFVLVAVVIYFLYLVERNLENRKEKLRFLGLMWGCLAGLNFLTAVYWAIEGEFLTSIISMIIAGALFIFSCFCSKASKEILQ